MYTGFAIAANGMVINKAIYFGAYYSFNKTILDHTNSQVSNKEKDTKLPFWMRFATAQVKLEFINMLYYFVLKCFIFYVCRLLHTYLKFSAIRWTQLDEC